MTDKKTRRTASIDQARFRVTVDKETFEFGPLPNHVKTYLGLLGLKTALLDSTVCAETFVALMAGTVPDPPKPAREKKSKWRSAIAHTMAHTRAGELNPGAPKKLLMGAVDMLMPEMETRVASLDRAVVKRLSERADVQAHYRRLFGSNGAGEQTSIFAMLEQPAQPLLEEVS